MKNTNKIYLKKIQTHLLESSAIKQKTARQCPDSILAATQLIIETLSAGNKVLICGNGGSAADSQHMAAEIVCGLNKSLNKSGLPAIALTTDTSVLTAYANDVDFEEVFGHQIQALGKPNDLLIAISTSGNSKNIIYAVKTAKSAKLHTVALSGNSGKLSKMTNVAISVPSSNTQYIQETHLAIEHILCELVEDYLFAQRSK